MVLSLWFGAAAPGLAAATEAPSPPAIPHLVGCTNGYPDAMPTVGRCPAVTRASSAAVLNTALRRLPLAVSGPTTRLLALTAFGAAGLLLAGRLRWPLRLLHGARAPPVCSS